MEALAARIRAILCVLIVLAGATLQASVHAAAPGIAWRAFDKKAFDEAKQKGQLVLLSIQAPWGHWERIMSEITFADPAVAALVSERFIPIKVDPLLRPDIFARYGMGGWPTTAFLLPSGQPLYFPDAARKLIKAGGTFYAAEPLRSYLEDLQKYYTQNRDAADKTANEVAEGVLTRKEVGSAPLTSDVMEIAVTKLLESQGEWNPDPNMKTYRVPDVDSARLACAYFMKKGDRSVLDTALHRMADMARGGIHDQLGGGFHRLASDAAWRVPAFEKLLTVNAEMLQAYAEVYMLTGASRYREVAEDTAGYILGTLHDPAGWFYAYQAAESRLGEDGDYYTWTLEEATSALSEEERKILLPAYDIGEWGELVNSAPRRNVLFLQQGPPMLAQNMGLDLARVTALFESGRDKLLQARKARTAPPVGKILIAEADAEAAAALIESGDLLRRQDLTDAGVKAVDFLWDKVRDPDSGLMSHAWLEGSGRSGPAEFFADQTQMVRALVAAYESTGEGRHLERAAQVATAADKMFADALNGGWMDRVFSPDAPGFLSWPTRSIRDNSLFAESLARLRYLRGRPEDEGLLKAARKGLESWADEFAKYKEVSAPFGLAVDHVLNPPVEVIVAGADDPAVVSLARSLYHPWRILRRFNTPSGAAELSARQITPPAHAAIFFCQTSRCAGPYTKDDKPRVKLDEFAGARRPPVPPPADGGKGANR